MPFVIEIGAALVAAAGTFITASAITSAVVGIGLSIATGYIMQSLMPKPKSGSENVPGGVQMQRQYGSDVPRQVACGLCGIAGHDVYFNTFNPANRTLQQVYVLSDYLTSGLSRVAIDGEYVTLGTDIGDGKGKPVTSGPKAGYIWVKYYDGRQSSADAFLTTFANPVGRWDSNCIGVGVSFVSILIEYDKDNNNSFPDFFFEFYGAPVYDWRKDSTAGGSGAHRFNDITTHEYSNNPILIEYHYRRGFSVNGDMFCGMGMPSTDLPLIKWTAAANICDEDVGGPRYQCSVLLNCMALHADNLRSLSLSCGSMQIDGLEGSWPLVGSDQPSVMTFTDEDIISVADNFKRTEKRSMSELVNSVSGNYPEPDQLWSMVDYELQISATHVVLDRRTRDISIDFPQVPNARQAAQLASIYLYENRYEATATVTLRPRFQVLEAGDWVDWNSARYGNKTFIVVSKQLIALENDGPRNVILQLQERDGSIYDGIAPPTPIFPTPPDAPDYIAEVSSFVAIPVLVTGTTGVVRPAIRVSWAALTDVTVIGVDLSYYPTSDTSSVIHKEVFADQSVVTLVEGVVSSTEYRVQAKIITSPSRVTTYNAGVLVTTLDAGTVGLGDLDGEIRYQLDQLQNYTNERLIMLENLISSTLANQGSRSWLDKKQLRYQLDATAGNAKASIEELRLVVVSDQQAFANYQLTVSASFGAVNSAVAVNASAIATLDGYAAAQYSVTLDVNGYASGFNLINGGPGYSSFTVKADKFAIQLPGYNGNAPVNVFTVGTINGVPAIGINGANVFLDGTLNATAINVTQLSAISANLGAITAGTMTDPSGTKMLIDLTNGRILIKQ